MQAIWRTLGDRQDALLTALVQHVQISLLALLLAVLIALPLAIVVRPHKRLASALLQISGVLQTIPSLALLGLLIPFLGIGTGPAIVALVVYALLPIVQNTLVGLNEVDPVYIEAADAFGMSRWRKLFKVELPLARPVIFSGIQTAMVMIVGTATLAALIGAGGLGTFILLGINRNDASLTLIGAVAAALLALLFSGLLRLLARWSWRRSALVILAIALLFGGQQLVSLLRPAPEKIVIAGKLGSEPEILLNMYEQLIKDSGERVEVTLKPNFGQTSFLYKALLADQVDIYPEFTGTVVTSLVKPSKEQQAKLDAGKDSWPIANELLEKKGLEMLKPMAYNNTYALVVRKEDAQKKRLETISDLAGLSQKLRAGFDLEFIDREDGYAGLKSAYGLGLDVTSLDAALRYQALADGKIAVTDGYSTDSQIAQYNLLALKDDRGVFTTYRGAPLMKQDFAKRHKKIVAALNRLANRISETDMQKMNYDVNVKKEPAKQVALRYLKQHKLLKGAAK